MQPRRVKVVAVAFAGLSIAAMVNLLLLQPQRPFAANGAGPRGKAEVLVFAPGAQPPRPVATPPTPSAAGTASARPATPSAVAQAPQPAVLSGQELVRTVQRELRGRGYEPGTTDGVSGLITRAAILGYEFEHNLPLTAEPSEALLRRILSGETLAAAGPSSSRSRSPEAEQVIRTVQQSLSRVGYKIAKIDGRLGDDTARAIHDFEVDQGMPQTGRISGQLVARLARLAGQGRLAGTP